MNTADCEKILEQELARRKHLNFVQYTWRQSGSFLIGYHTIVICNLIDKAFENYRSGKSTFFIVCVPYRHGKSELTSRTMIPHFLGEFPEKEVILVTHTADRSYEFSRDARELIRDNKKFKELYPDIKLADESQNVKVWRIDNNIGKAQFYGFRSGISGSGGDCVLIDDFFKNREDAESETVQSKVIQEFTSGITTRMPHPFILGIVATRWNLQDLVEYCIQKAKEDKDFPQPEVVFLPAESKKYESGYLFPAKYPPKYYKQQRAVLSEYEYAGLMQQEPVLKGGNAFKIDGIQIITEKEFPKINLIMTVDLASTEKQRQRNKKVDPDYTVALCGGMIYDKGIPKIYIYDMLRIQESAVKRNKKLEAFFLLYEKTIYMETFGAYKDSYEIMKDTFRGKLSIRSLELTGDKEAKAQPLEVIFEQGNIYLLKRPWNNDFKHECALFPKGKHDDIVDCLSMIYHIFKRKPTITAGRGVW